MTGIGLEFLPNPGGKAEGLSDAGIETFRDKPFAAVARETGQNSRDARQNSEAPVRLTFDVVKVDSAGFPSIEEYRNAARICLDKARKRKNEKEIGFFQQAVKVLSEPQISILRISDFNTKGVRGPCEEGRPFHTLAKTDGMSVKDDINSGGSFGIGKSAVFAISDIQTAIFSTRYIDDGNAAQVLCMGKTLFISHTGGDGKEKGREGYWGKKNGYMPLDSAREIPLWLLRPTQGTSIFSVCMRSHRTDWRYEMAAAILMNFFCAIERQEMEFEIDNGSLKINKGTLQAFFQDPKVNAAVNQLNARAAFDATRMLHTCLIDETSTIRILDVQGLGRVKMRILLRDGLSYTLGIVRNGMYITDNLANFNQPFKRFPLHREFAAIVEPEGPTEGEWFKRLENPRHDDLSAERITDPTLREQGERAFLRLAKQIRDTIRDLARSEPTSSMELDELNDFFASEESRIEEDDGPEIDPRSFKPSPIKRASPPARRTVERPDGDEIDKPGPEPEPDPLPDPPNPNPDPRPGPFNRPKPAADPIALANERNLLPDGRNASKRQLWFTPPVAGEITLYVEATGVSLPERISIVGSDTGRVENGCLIIICEPGQRLSPIVEFDSAYSGPIEISAFQITKTAEAAK
jgi:hypothetical protein